MRCRYNQIHVKCIDGQTDRQTDTYDKIKKSKRLETKARQEVGKLEERNTRKRCV